ncbi:MAG: response regulator [Cellvibrionaceae bacterium]
MRLLIVEDNKIIGDGLLIAMKLESYAVDWVESSKSASQALAAHHYDMLLLDIGLPDGSGLDLLTEVRAKRNDIPILILTAYDDICDKIKGLDTGADDYLTKPFDLDELKARVRALHRRRDGHASVQLVVGAITLDTSNRIVTVKDKPIHLGSKEFALLQILMEKPGKVFSKRVLEDSLYGWGMEVESNTIEVHISHLRKKLGKKTIETIKYVGYRIMIATP